MHRALPPAGDFPPHNDPSSGAAWLQLAIVLLLMAGLGLLAVRCTDAPMVARNTCAPASAGAGAVP